MAKPGLSNPAQFLHDRFRAGGAYAPAVIKIVALAGGVLVLVAGCGLVADEPSIDAGPDAAPPATPCAIITDTGRNVQTSWMTSAMPDVSGLDVALSPGLYVMVERELYGGGTDPSATLRKTIELLPSGEVVVVKVDHAATAQRGRFRAENGELKANAMLQCVCGEAETWTFRIVPLSATRFALVGRRGARTVIERYEPAPPL
jgi:hypothetical protein